MTEPLIPNDLIEPQRIEEENKKEEIVDNNNENIKIEEEIKEKEENKPITEEESKKETNEVTFKDLKYKKEKRFVKLSFLIFGIGGLLAWNAILSDLDFFNYYLPKAPIKPDVIYPFMNFALNILFQFVLICNKKILSYKIQLLFTIIISMITLILLPLSVILFDFDQKLGFYLSCGVVLLQGFINAVCLSSFFGLVSYFPVENIVMLSTGQGVAGILMNVIKYITLVSLTSFDEKTQNIIGTLIFFSISAVIMFICFIFVLLVYKNQYFIDVLRSTDENPEKQRTTVSDEIADVSALVSDSSASERTAPKTFIKEAEEGSFCNLIKSLIDINILIFVMYTTTFTVYPSACLTPALFDLPMNWKPNTFITIFNVVDTLGRNMLNCIKPRKGLLYTLTMVRILLIATLPLNVYLDTHGYNSSYCSLFLVFNVVFLAITNGLCTSLAFAIAPTMVEDNMKGKAGSSVGFFNIVGIFTGTCTAFGMNALLQKISKL